MIVLEYQRRTAKENMALDKLLLEKMAEGDEPILHIYDWQRPSLTFGVLAKPKNFLNFEALEALGIDAARRSTGGGMIFHMYDLAFSFICPNSHPQYQVNVLDNYLWVNKIVQKALAIQSSLLETESISNKNILSQFCMSKGTKYDIMLGQKKIYGAAQRRKKNAFLHQASISLFRPDFSLIAQSLLDAGPIVKGMQKTGAYLFDNQIVSDKKRAQIHKSLKQSFLRA